MKTTEKWRLHWSGGLKREGYAVDVAYDGDQGEYCAENVAYDLSPYCGLRRCRYRG